MKTKINHILPIVLAVVLPALSLFSHAGSALQGSMNIFESWFLASVILYMLWYVLWYLWDIRAHYSKWWFLSLIALAAGLFSGVFYLVVYKNPEQTGWLFVFRVFTASVLFIAIQYALKAQQNISRLLLEKEQVQTENLKVQLKALRAKIDPHFLFNSLNTLRTMVRQQHVNAEQFVMSLSDFFRQTLRHNENTTLQLAEELDVLQSYLFLMKSRHAQAFSVTVNIESASQQFHLPTLALQLVVENCFKHNSMTTKNPLQIEINQTRDFYIEVKNNIQPKIGTTDSSGYGLELLRKRYELMNIPQGLIVEKQADYFCVKLKLI